MKYFDYSSTKTAYHCLTLFKYTIWVFYYFNRFGWFRLFGWGLVFKDERRHGLIFSERQGARKGITINHWRIRLLKANRQNLL